MNGVNSEKATLWAERWTPVIIEVEGVENPPRYEVSNFGRLRSFQNNEKGEVIKGSVIQGYKSLNIRLPKGKSFNRYVHKLVAETFVSKPSPEHKFVIHLDFDKMSNHFENLKWVTKDEMVEHNRQNPAVINKPIPKRTKNYKLTESKVKMIKKMLQNESTRLKMIAKQFGITHTQLNRIRSGENWGYVTVE
ncbi:NUMOD4 domain-containing protein [Emticicia oligotrophica DSM 17448]|uniref:NUMOD4 domain-containing protein n=1 Tax=Emticicia oligotrophica (strain DSM 17448 / CIP 109782 / MTCC 6937 / GPTSA100-15) TaxID=929562 RepID=A0ABM5N0W2_EMTOG|nr:NUMOD4 domain-containing protein [Emticicia oligotrophica]AFK03043.1 NUMOD4 domain-containing protein [Emticicia oligotrophica DSM 17448]